MSRLFQRIVGELRDKRLWPVALALVLAIVAVPILLLKSPSPAPTTAGSPGTTPPSSATSLPTISEQSTPSQSHLRGPARDPFIQGATGHPATATAAPGVTGAGGVAGTSSTHSTSPVSTGGAVVVPPVSQPTAPPSITHGVTPPPAPSGLTPTQSYDVAMSVTNASGGLDAVDPLERLSVLPSAQTPMLVELGVLRGGRRVLFAVQPGTAVNGPGVCTPGPIDCEVLSLAPGQTEGMSRQTAAGAIQGPLFAVTGITAADQSSTRAATAARRQEVGAGRTLIDNSPLTALSMFRYDPSQGVMVDLRDLSVGGS